MEVTNCFFFCWIIKRIHQTRATDYISHFKVFQNKSYDAFLVYHYRRCVRMFGRVHDKTMNQKIRLVLHVLISLQFRSLPRCIINIFYCDVQYSFHSVPQYSCAISAPKYSSDELAMNVQVQI